MLPNKTVAALFVGLLLLQTLPGPANAQTGLQPDLVVLSVDVGSNRVRGIDAPVTIIVKNQGNGTFTAATGWQVFVGLDGYNEANCIEPGAGQVQTASDCYQRVPPGDPRTSIAAGNTVTFTFMWNATKGTVPNVPMYVHTEIGALGATPGDNSGNSCSGPDAPRCENNRQTWPIFVKAPGVRAVPLDRVEPPTANSNVNTAWNFQDVPDEPCPVAPATLKIACRAPPGKLLVASYNLKNLGNAQDSFTGSVLDGEQLFARGYQFFFAPEVVTLGPNQEKEVRLQILVPETEVANSKVNINNTRSFARWTSSLNGAIHTDLESNPGCDENNGKLIQDGFCQDPSLPSLIVGFKRDVNATSNETFRTVYTGEQATFNITLNNTGNAPDTYVIKLDRERMFINDSWLPSISNPGLVQPKTERNASISILPPANATNRSYTFDVLIQSAGDTNGTTLRRLKFHAALDQRFGLAGAADVPARIVPGEEVKYNLAITNTGNGIDNVTLDLQGTVFDWNARLSTSTLQIPPFETRTFTLTARPPPNTAENLEASFFVNATSEGPRDMGFDQRVKAPPIQSRATVLRGPNMLLAVPVNTTFIDPGKSFEYDVLVTNTGNVADNVSISAVPQHPDWVVTYTPNSTVLEPTGQAVFRVKVRAPGEAAVGETSKTFVSFQSTVNPALTRQTTLEGRVSGPDLFASGILADSGSPAPYEGDLLTVSATVGNGGNKMPDRNVTLRVYFVQGGIERAIGERVFTPQELPAGRQFAVTFEWNTTGVEGAGMLLSRIDVGDRVSEIDETVGSNEATRAITLRTFDIRVVPAQGLSGRPGEKISYTEQPNVFLVEYRGNQPTEPVTIKIESEHGWGSSEAQLALPRGSVIPILVTLDIPARPGAAQDTLRITVTPGLRPNAVVTASTTTTVIDDERPRIVAITVTPPSPKLGEDATIEAIVTDATGLSAVRAFVLTPANETMPVVLSPAGNDRFTRTQPWTVAGRYRVSIEATDGAQPANTNSTRELVGNFVVQPGSAPVVKLAEGQGTTIRTGSFVKLNITDPLGVAKASYTIKGITYDLARPAFQIDTSSFTAGTVDLAVTAENIYGAATTARFTLTVDNTPPGIRGVTITPAEPKASEDVTVRIETDAKVEAVEVLIKKDGAVVETRTAVRKAQGNFELLFNPGEGAYTIDVTAKDAAGNTKLAQGAVVFTSKPGSPFDVPAPGFALVALALAVAVLLARRRS